MAGTRALRTDDHVLEIDGFRLRLKDRDGRRVRAWSTDGSALPGASAAARGVFAVPTADRALHVIRVERGDFRTARLPQRAARVWLRRDRLLALGRDRGVLLDLHDLRALRAVRARGRIDVERTRVAWPVAGIPAHREAHVLHLGRGEALRVAAASKVGRVGLYLGRVVLVERERVHLVDGRTLEDREKLSVSQALRPETLRVARGLAVVLARDVAVLCDLPALALRAVRLPERVREAEIRGREFRLTTRSTVFRYDREGRETGREATVK